MRQEMNHDNTKNIRLFFTLVIMHSCLIYICVGKKEKHIEENLHLASSVAIADSALYSAGLYPPYVVDTKLWVSPCQPRHVHLSVGVTPWNSMTISFSLKRACNLNDLTTILTYGIADKNTKSSKRTDFVINFEQQMNMFNYSSTKKRFQKYESDYIFHVPLLELEPAQKYFYQISVMNSLDNSGEKQLYRRRVNITGSEIDFAHGSTNYSVSNKDHDIVASSPSYYFKTVAQPEEKTGTKMIIVADLGQTYNASVTMMHMYKETLSDQNDKPASLVLCGGDCSYSDSNPHRWDSWFDIIEPLISRIPFQLVAGNHEIECDMDTYDVFTPMEYRFRMPRIQPAIRSRNEDLCLVRDKRGRVRNIPSAAVFNYDYGNSFYSFTHGITRVIALNCYTYTHQASRQYEWLENEFKSINRNITPWILVLVHCPLYNTFHDHHNEFNSKDMLRSMEHLFIEYHVNFVLCGHSHGYMRTTGIAYNKVDPKAPIYIIVGEGGNRENHSPGYKYIQPEEWLVKRDNTEYGFGTMDFLNSTVAHWKWIRNFNTGDKDFTDEVHFLHEKY